MPINRVRVRDLLLNGCILASVQMTLSDIVRGMILGSYLTCRNMLTVSRTLDIPYSTVHYWIRRYEQSRTVVAKHSPGRPRKTCARSDRRLYRLARVNGFATCNDLLRHWQERVSRFTVLRRLHERHLHQYRPCRVPLLTRDNKRTRLEWAMRRCHWRDLWKRVVFSDESRFLLHPVSGRTLVWRLPGERLNEQSVLQVIAHGGGSVHVLGAIWIGGRSNLVRLQVRRDQGVRANAYCEVLHAFFVTSVLPAHCWFQHDNASIHTSWITQQLLEDMHIRVLP